MDFILDKQCKDMKIGMYFPATFILQLEPISYQFIKWTLISMQTSLQNSRSGLVTLLVPFTAFCLSGGKLHLLNKTSSYGFFKIHLKFTF